MNVQQFATAIRENVSRVIVGKDNEIDLIVAAILAGGHVLMEDVPGTGKTLMAKTLAKSVSAQFKRVQFTPDLLPTDVTGLSVTGAQGNSCSSPARCSQTYFWRTR